MRFINSYGLILASALFLSTQAHAQRIPAIPVLPIGGQVQTSPAIGPDGTYYVVAPGTGNTLEAPVSELEAVGLTGNGTKWTKTINGNINSVLPGQNTVFVVQTTTTGSGRTSTTTTSVLLFETGNSAGTTGGASAGSTITPSGSISDIEVRTVSGADYLYVYSITSTTTTNGGTTTVTTAHTLTIYSATGTVVKTVNL